MQQRLISTISRPSLIIRIHSCLVNRIVILNNSLKYQSTDFLLDTPVHSSSSMSNDDARQNRHTFASSKSQSSSDSSYDNDDDDCMMTKITFKINEPGIQVPSDDDDDGARIMEIMRGLNHGLNSRASNSTNQDMNKSSSTGLINNRSLPPPPPAVARSTTYVAKSLLTFIFFLSRIDLVLEPIQVTVQPISSTLQICSRHRINLLSFLQTTQPQQQQAIRMLHSFRFNRSQTVHNKVLFIYLPINSRRHHHRMTMTRKSPIRFIKAFHFRCYKYHVHFKL